MKNLVLDIGNLRIMPAFFEGDVFISIWSLEQFCAGVKFELKEFIEAYRVNFPKISIYLCGGDAESFDSLAKDHIFVVPNLVLIGLNCILNHHVA
jgi:pantothenate kinase type III